MERALTIVFALYPRLTQLDFTGPFEVLSRLRGAQVTVATKEGGDVTSDTGLMFGNMRKLSAIERCDVICVPGGYGVTEALSDAAFIAEVRRLGEGARYVTSVCSGSLILAAAGLLHGKRAACHWAWRELLGESGAVPVHERIVRDGNVITGGGVTAGIDFALCLAAEIAGEEAAQAIQLAIEYDPEPPFDAGSPEKVRPEVLASVRERLAPLYPERRAALRAALELTRGK